MRIEYLSLRVSICLWVVCNMLCTVTSILTKHNLFKIFMLSLMLESRLTLKILTYYHTISWLHSKRLFFSNFFYVTPACSCIFNWNGRHCAICNFTYIHSDCMNWAILFAKCKIPQTCWNIANFLWYLSLELAYPYQMRLKFSPYKAGIIEYQR